MVKYLSGIESGKYKVVSAAMPSAFRGSATGYGRKIPCPYMVQDTTTGHKYRVYAICYSNCASHYVMVRGIMYFLRDGDFPEN